MYNSQIFFSSFDSTFADSTTPVCGDLGCLRVSFSYYVVGFILMWSDLTPNANSRFYVSF